MSKNIYAPLHSTSWLVPCIYSLSIVRSYILLFRKNMCNINNRVFVRTFFFFFFHFLKIQHSDAPDPAAPSSPTTKLRMRQQNGWQSAAAGLWCYDAMVWLPKPFWFGFFLCVCVNTLWLCLKKKLVLPTDLLERNQISCSRHVVYQARQSSQESQRLSSRDSEWSIRNN